MIRARVRGGEGRGTVPRGEPEIRVPESRLLPTLRIGVAVLAGVVPPAACAPAQAECPVCAEAAALIEELNLQEEPVPVRERPGWAPPTRIVTIGGEPMAALLRTVAPAAEVVGVTSEAEALVAVRTAEVYVGSCSAAILEAAPQLRWIQAPSAGVEGCAALPELQRRDILVTNAQRLYGPQIAEHVMAMTLSFARGLHRYREAQGEGRWARDLSGEAWLIAGKTMLVVGLGGIGTEVAWRAHALGMRVLATRNSSRSGPDYVEYVGLADEADDLAARADVVVNALPLTDQTRGMFDDAFFDAMKRGAYFINVGRGGTVVTADLVRALRAGQLAGAGLDVTDPEPLPAGHPLWSMPNVILTPHVAGDSDDRTFDLLAAENVRRYVAGDRMLSVVDLDRGY